MTGRAMRLTDILLLTSLLFQLVRYVRLDD
jgi:hypothetical protein